jgi:predicted nuclease with RNAse H fold
LRGKLATMLTVGVDLSAEEPRTWMASISWHRASAEVIALESNVSNQRIIEASRTADKVGIDCPFGWPVPFVDFVQEHLQGDVHVRDGQPIAWRRELAYRSTDRFVTNETGLRPLSVAADRIAHPAMRCAALLSDMRAANVPVDRSGVQGRVVEVYPAGSLKVWNLIHRGYKRLANVASLDSLVAELLTAAPWLHLGAYEMHCRRTDDAFDAVVAALSARAAALGLTWPPPPSLADTATREGWIALPRENTLALLTNG